MTKSLLLRLFTVCAVCQTTHSSPVVGRPTSYEEDVQCALSDYANHTKSWSKGFESEPLRMIKYVNLDDTHNGDLAAFVSGKRKPETEIGKRNKGTAVISLYFDVPENSLPGGLPLPASITTQRGETWQQSPVDDQLYSYIATEEWFSGALMKSIQVPELYSAGGVKPGGIVMVTLQVQNNDLGMTLGTAVYPLYDPVPFGENLLLKMVFSEVGTDRGAAEIGLRRASTPEKTSFLTYHASSFRVMLIGVALLLDIPGVDRLTTIFSALETMYKYVTRNTGNLGTVINKLEDVASEVDSQRRLQGPEDVASEVDSQRRLQGPKIRHWDSEVIIYANCDTYWWCYSDDPELAFTAPADGFHFLFSGRQWMAGRCGVFEAVGWYHTVLASSSTEVMCTFPGADLAYMIDYGERTISSKSNGVSASRIGTGTLRQPVTGEVTLTEYLF